MSSLFFEVLLPCLGGNALRTVVSFSQTQANSVGWKGTYFLVVCWGSHRKVLCCNAVLATHKGFIMPAEAMRSMSFLFCSGSSKQFARNFPHTCETSTGSNAVSSRLAAVCNGTPVDLDRLRQDSNSYWDSWWGSYFQYRKMCPRCRVLL